MKNPIPVVYARPKLGRRPSSMVPAKRRKHIDAARLIDFEGMRAADVAKFLGCKTRAVYKWARLAREYPEYEKLRRAIAS